MKANEGVLDVNCRIICPDVRPPLTWITETRTLARRPRTAHRFRAGG